MSTLKGIKTAFREIGKTAQEAGTKPAGQAISTIVKKTGIYASAPLGLGLGVGVGSYAATKGISESVNNLTETEKTTTNKAYEKKQQELLKIGFTIALLYFIFKK